MQFITVDELLEELVSFRKADPTNGDVAVVVCDIDDRTHLLWGVPQASHAFGHRTFKIRCT